MAGSRPPGNLEQARADLEEAIALGDGQGAATARLHLAFVHTPAGEALDALTVLEQCRPQPTRCGLTWEEGASWLLAAWAHITEGDVIAGEAACLRALQPLGDGWAMAHTEGLPGELALALARQLIPRRPCVSPAPPTPPGCWASKPRRRITCST